MSNMKFVSGFHSLRNEMADNLHSLIAPWTEPVDNACRGILGIQTRNYYVLDVLIPMGNRLSLPCLNTAKLDTDDENISYSYTGCFVTFKHMVVKTKF